MTAIKLDISDFEAEGRKQEGGRRKKEKGKRKKEKESFSKYGMLPLILWIPAIIQQLLEGIRAVFRNSILR